MKATVGSQEWWASLVTLLVFGYCLGCDRFYRGQIFWGIVKTIVVSGALIFAIVAFAGDSKAMAAKIIPLSVAIIWMTVDFCCYLYRFGKTGQWEKPLKVTIEGVED